jgi:hypothetical protein
LKFHLLRLASAPALREVATALHIPGDALVDSLSRHKDGPVSSQEV